MGSLIRLQIAPENFSLLLSVIEPGRELQVKEMDDRTHRELVKFDRDRFLCTLKNRHVLFVHFIIRNVE
jgi:hypothetical protein